MRSICKQLKSEYEHETEKVAKVWMNAGHSGFCADIGYDMIYHKIFLLECDKRRAEEEEKEGEATEHSERKGRRRKGKLPRKFAKVRYEEEQ